VIEVLRTDFVAVPVDDIRRAEAFYGDTLGLARNPNTSGERWVEFETGNLTIALSQFGAAIGLGVPDVDEARAALEEAGVEFGNDTFDSGVCNGAGFKDPDANSLLLHKRYAPLERYAVPEQEVQRADFVGVFTTDLARAEPFYEDVLGLRRDPNHTEGWPDFHTGNVSLLVTDVARTGQEFRPNGGSVALRVADVGASMERLKAKGVRFDFDEVYDSGVCHMAFFKDSEGNGLMLHHRYAPYRDGTQP
jgi:catechol 2,3-dioxygenase-like lactoylglutathione lyase family enzyme